jgi:hypothetical protein
VEKLKGEIEALNRTKSSPLPGSFDREEELLGELKEKERERQEQLQLLAQELAEGELPNPIS